MSNNSNELNALLEIHEIATDIAEQRGIASGNREALARAAKSYTGWHSHCGALGFVRAVNALVESTREFERASK
jgi:hypothetical protein